MTMTKLIPYFIFLILTLSCYSRKIETQLEPNIIYSESSEMNIKENIDHIIIPKSLETKIKETEIFISKKNKYDDHHGVYISIE